MEGSNKCLDAESNIPAISEQEVKEQHATETARKVPVVILNLVTAWELAQHGKGCATTHMKTIILCFFYSYLKTKTN